MAVDLAVVGVSMDTTGVKQGEAVVVRSFANVADAGTRMAASVQKAQELVNANAQADRRAATERKALGDATAEATEAERAAAQALQERLDRENQVRAALEKRREAMRAQGITAQQVAEMEATAIRTPEQVRQAAIASLARMTEEQRKAIAVAQQRAAAERAATESWVAGARNQAAAASTVAPAVARVGAAAEGSTRGVKTAQNALNALAISAAGIPGPFGRVVSSMSMLAVGGVATVAVVAGLSAIVAVLSKIGEESREAKRRTDDLIGSLLQSAAAYREQVKPMEVFAEKMVDINKRHRELTAQLASAQRGRLVGGQNTERLVVDQAEVARIQAELISLGVAAGEAMRQAHQQVTANTAVVAESSQAVARAFGSLAEFQRDAAHAIAMAHGDTARVIELEYAERIERVEQLFAGLSASGRTQAAALRAEWIAALERGREVERLISRLGPAPTPRVVGGGGLTLKPLNLDIGPDPFRAEQEAFEREAQARFEASLRTTTDAFQRGFAAIWENGYRGFADFFDAVAQLGVQAAASIAASMTIEALGIDNLLQNLALKNGKSSWSLGRGFRGEGSFAANVGAGFIGGQVGGSLGASQSSGFGAGAVGGLSGAAAGFAAGGPVGAIVGGVTGIVSGLLGQAERAKEATRRFAEAQKAFDLALQSYVATVAGDQLTQALAANQAQVDQLIAQATDLASQRFKQLDLGDLADGDAAGIFADLRQQIDEITAASKQLEEQLKAEHAARAQALGEDLQVRALRAQGLDAEADALAMAIAHQRERLALEKELGDQFDATLQAQLAYVQGLEVEAAAKAKAEEAARKAAELAERQQYFREDLEVRALAASGDTAGAEALRRRIAYEREYAEAVKAGMDEATLAMLRNVQAAEELAIAQAEAAEKAQDLIDAMNAEARAMENLEVRHYRAIGQHDFAEEARMRFEHEEETRRAIEEGRSDSYMQFMRQVQQEERDAFTKSRQDAQQKAWDDAVRSAFPKDAKFLEDRTSVNLAVGVSESTVNRMVGVLQSQLIMQQSLPRIESSNAEAVQLLRAIAVALGGNLLAVVDQGLATMSADSDLAAGVPPGNR